MSGLSRIHQGSDWGARKICDVLQGGACFQLWVRATMMQDPVYLLYLLLRCYSLHTYVRLLGCRYVCM